MCRFPIDSFVRQLFNCAIDERTLESDRVLRRKDRKDTAMENKLWEAGSSSATALAAQEAMVDRSKKFWHSRWAKKLSKTMVSFVSLTFLQPSQSLFPLSSVLLPLPISSHLISCHLILQTWMFSGDDKNNGSPSTTAKGEGNLVNTSSVSRKLAHGGNVNVSHPQTTEAAACTAHSSKHGIKEELQTASAARFC